jgi:hypothetical protein
MGPATVYVGAFGATEPVDSAFATPPSSTYWTDVGGTADGTSVLMETDLTYTDLAVDQLIDSVGARLTKRMVQLTAALAETTLANMNIAMNQLLSISAQSTYSTGDPQTTSSATQPTYTALILDGWAPTLNTGAAARRRIILRKCLSASKLALEYEKAKPAVYNTVWTAYFVSSSIALFHITDQTA